MLRTVGMTRQQVMRQILTEASILGIVGSVLGIGFGILLSRGLIQLMEVLLAQEVKEAQVPLQGLAISLMVGLGVTLAAASLPAWQASRISPLEALRIRGTATSVGWATPLSCCFFWAAHCWFQSRSVFGSEPRDRC
jgi:putative ABC transport system permease protein